MRISPVPGARRLASTERDAGGGASFEPTDEDPTAMLDALTNGATEAVQALDETPLRVFDHPEVREVADRLKEKREAMKTLRRNHRTVLRRRRELEEAFDAALKGENDRDPGAVRDERIELEQEHDRFQERRVTLKHEIGILEQDLEETAKEKAAEIEAAVEDPMLELHERLVEDIEQAARTALALDEALGRLPRGHWRLPFGFAKIPQDLSHRPVRVGGLLGRIGRFLQKLQEAGYDVDLDLLQKLR